VFKVSNKTGYNYKNGISHLSYLSPSAQLEPKRLILSSVLTE